MRIDYIEMSRKTNIKNIKIRRSFPKTDLYEKSITGLLNILDTLYDAARHEETGFESSFAKVLDRDGFYPIKKASTEKRKEITLYVLNKVKEYNNTGVETYKVIFK